MYFQSLMIENTEISLLISNEMIGWENIYTYLIPTSIHLTFVVQYLSIYTVDCVRDGCGKGLWEATVRTTGTDRCGSVRTVTADHERGGLVILLC